MADYNLSKGGPPRFSNPGASGPGLPLNAAALRLVVARNAEFVRWYEDMVAARYPSGNAPARRRLTL